MIVCYNTTMEKICSKCLISKPLDQFHKRAKNADGHAGTCKICKGAYEKQYYQDNPSRKVSIRESVNSRRAVNRDWVLQYLKQHPCVDCKETDVVVLEFDHRDRSTKIKDVAQMIRHSSLPDVIAEVEKCDVRCANCHKRVTAKQFGWWKLIGE